MSKTNEGANASFRGMSRYYPLYTQTQRNSNVFRNIRIQEKTTVESYLLVEKTITLGNDVEKDMGNENYTNELDPFEAQSSLFPGMADFIEDNIELGDKNEEDRFQASYWNDLGNDIFDNWGYFFFYDVARGKYYFPLLTPQNQDNGIITDQLFNCFGVQFGIRHGWRAKGIFMMDVSCSNSAFDFRFGCYGNWGAGNNDSINYDVTAPYGDGQTLYYHYYEDSDDSDSDSALYAYFVPYRNSDKLTKPYQCRIYPENNDENSLITNVIREGVTVYFSAKNDVKNWVIIDLTTGDFSLENGDIKAEGNIETEENITARGDITTNNGNIFSDGVIIARGYNLGRSYFTSINNENVTPNSDIINGYFLSNTLSENRNFYLPDAEILSNAIPYCQERTSFRFTINNYANIESGYSWNLNTENSNLNMTGVKNSTIPPGAIITYLVILQIDEGSYGWVLQESDPQYFLG
jgi:hypothetical protein